MGRKLTSAEEAVMEFIGTMGLTNSRIARLCGISPRTVAQHRAHIYEKLGVHDVTSLITLYHKREKRV